MQDTTEVTCCECVECGSIAYSRARHDMHSCDCGSIAIDGGFDYVKLCYREFRPKLLKYTIQASKEDLYQDWRTGVDKYGIIKKEDRIKDKEVYLS